MRKRDGESMEEENGGQLREDGDLEDKGMGVEEGDQ